MKKSTSQSLLKLIAVVVMFFWGFWSGHLFWPKYSEFEQKTVDTVLTTKPDPTLDDHISAVVPTKLQNICRALVWVESRGNAKAYRESGNCMGILQITPIYVKECNRLQSKVTYTLEDRTDIVKSLEMFTIIQNHHNPGHDLEKAIQLHNPTAGPGYRAEVLQRFETIY